MIYIGYAEDLRELQQFVKDFEQATKADIESAQKYLRAKRCLDMNLYVIYDDETHTVLYGGERKEVSVRF